MPPNFVSVMPLSTLLPIEVNTLRARSTRSAPMFTEYALKNVVFDWVLHNLTTIELKEIGKERRMEGPNKEERMKEGMQKEKRERESERSLY